MLEVRSRVPNSMAVPAAVGGSFGERCEINCYQQGWSMTASGGPARYRLEAPALARGALALLSDEA